MWYVITCIALIVGFAIGYLYCIASRGKELFGELRAKLKQEYADKIVKFMKEAKPVEHTMELCEKGKHLWGQWQASSRTLTSGSEAGGKLLIERQCVVCKRKEYMQETKWLRNKV